MVNSYFFRVIKYVLYMHAMYCNIFVYHIFCCNTFVCACPIIARSQGWLFAPRANTGKYPYLPSAIRICPQIQLPVSAQWSQSTRKDGA